MSFTLYIGKNVHLAPCPDLPVQAWPAFSGIKDEQYYQEAPHILYAFSLVVIHFPDKFRFLYFIHIYTAVLLDTLI